MWRTDLKELSFNGSVMVDIGGGTHVPLRGVLVDVYRFSIGGDGFVDFERLNQVAERTDSSGDFSFSNLRAPVKVQTVTPGSPPYTPVEITNPSSLPNLAFRISVEAEVFKGITGTSAESLGFEIIYDEKEVIDQDIDEEWSNSHPERYNVPLSGGPSIQVLIPEGNENATRIAGVSSPTPTVPGKEFHFLRVGRVIRQEIGELGDTRPEYVGKPGYMRSSNTWGTPEPSFFSDIFDAPFGGNLHIGGHFGSDLLTRDIYYTVSVWEYSGNPASPLSPGTHEQILDPLFNKVYILPTSALPKGKWKTLNLGPFDGTITSVEGPPDPGLVGTLVKVYKRPPPRDDATEYWPFWDLIVLWNSVSAPNDLCILILEAFERTGGSETSPELKKIDMTASVNGHLPLKIDNRPQAPDFLHYGPDGVFYTAEATFFGGSSETISASVEMNDCNIMEVTSGSPLNGNECILVRYIVGDGSGNPHQHLKDYRLLAEYTPAGASSSVEISLKDAFDKFENIKDEYDPNITPTAPIMEVNNFESVVVPDAPNGWPPEDGVCSEYALEVELRSSVRTINGWSHLFSTRHVSRHIILKKV